MCCVKNCAHKLKFYLTIPTLMKQRTWKWCSGKVIYVKNMWVWFHAKYVSELCKCLSMHNVNSLPKFGHTNHLFVSKISLEFARVLHAQCLVIPVQHKCQYCYSHREKGNCHTHVANDSQRECNRIRVAERCCTEQYGKVCEVVAFTHCCGDVG